MIPLDFPAEVSPRTVFLNFYVPVVGDVAWDSPENCVNKLRNTLSVGAKNYVQSYSLAIEISPDVEFELSINKWNSNSITKHLIRDALCLVPDPLRLSYIEGKKTPTINIEKIPAVSTWFVTNTQLFLLLFGLRYIRCLNIWSAN